MVYLNLYAPDVSKSTAKYVWHHNKYFLSKHPILEVFMFNKPTKSCYTYFNNKKVILRLQYNLLNIWFLKSWNDWAASKKSLRNNSINKTHCYLTTFLQLKYLGLLILLQEQSQCPFPKLTSSTELKSSFPLVL